jgi:hypothetical protein
VNWPTKALTESQYDTRRDYTIATSAAFTNRREKAFVFPSGESAYQFVVTASRLPSWIEKTISAYSGIQNLNENWDSYGGKKINHDLIRSSLSILAQVMEDSSPAPAVVPLGDGGLQLEWHRKQQDLEVVFPADDTPQFFYQNRSTGVEQEGFACDVLNLAQLLRKIA